MELFFSPQKNFFFCGRSAAEVRNKHTTLLRTHRNRAARARAVVMLPPSPALLSGRLAARLTSFLLLLLLLSSVVVVDAAGGSAVSTLSSGGANSTTPSSAQNAVARSWSYVCLCAISEFRAGCLADAKKLCSDPANAVIQLSERSCEEAANGEVGYYLVHEVDVKCKHPYTYNKYEAYNLVKALGFTNVDFAKLNASEIDGTVLFGLTVEQAEHMGLSVGAARHVSSNTRHATPRTHTHTHTHTVVFFNLFLIAHSSIIQKKTEAVALSCIVHFLSLSLSLPPPRRTTVARFHR